MNWWPHLRDFLAGLFAKQRVAETAAQQGTELETPIATVAVPITATGYSVEEERAAAVSRLAAAQAEAIAMFPADPIPGPGDQPRHSLVKQEWRTKCNFGVQHVAHALYCHDLDGLRADQMVQKLGAGYAPWREDSLERGVEHALRGGLAIVGWDNPADGKSGHVATIAPREMALSPSWGVKVPFLANVGTPEAQGIKLMSACFRRHQAHAIRCFLWKVGEV